MEIDPESETCYASVLTLVLSFRYLEPIFIVLFLKWQGWVKASTQIPWGYSIDIDAITLTNSILLTTSKTEWLICFCPCISHFLSKKNLIMCNLHCPRRDAKWVKLQKSLAVPSFFSTSKVSINKTNDTQTSKSPDCLLLISLPVWGEKGTEKKKKAVSVIKTEKRTVLLPDHPIFFSNTGFKAYLVSWAQTRERKSCLICTFQNSMATIPSGMRATIRIYLMWITLLVSGVKHAGNSTAWAYRKWRGLRWQGQIIAEWCLTPGLFLRA